MSEELGESELGTQEYWDTRYNEDIRNYKRHGDVGEIWFGEDISDRIIRWLEKNVSTKCAIADVGCGNGMLLVDLARSGFDNLTGIDYSENAISLAKEIMKQNSLSFKLEVCDILNSGSLLSSYDVIIDKGTYDAVCLMKDSKVNREAYVKNIYSFLKNDGLLFITSCNWTANELEEQFQHKFSTRCVVPTPQFKFGGKVGNVVSCVVFKKRLDV